MNKKIGLICLMILLLVYWCCIYTYSKYVFRESFVAFRLENVTVVDNNLNKKNSTKNETKNEVKQEDNIEDDSSVNSSGWVDIVRVEH